jgi:hypothetical protein
MALILTTELNAPQGYIINNGYIRLTVVDEKNGEKLLVKGYLYLDKQSYEEGLLDIVGVLDIDLEIGYSRTNNGTDSLDYSHDVIKDYLLNKFNITSIKEI